jgi:O-antigen/teichoic acid export membrane protein
MLAVAALLAAALPIFLPLIFGQDFKPAVELAWILLPGFIAHGYATIVDAGMVGMRTPWVGNLSQGAGALVTASLLPFLLPAYEAKGAAIVSSLAYTVSAGVALWASSRIYRTGLAATPAPPPVAVDPYDIALAESVPRRFPSS